MAKTPSKYFVASRRHKYRNSGLNFKGTLDSIPLTDNNLILTIEEPAFKKSHLKIEYKGEIVTDYLINVDSFKNYSEIMVFIKRAIDEAKAKARFLDLKRRVGI